jgi:hypothetical protein
VPYVDTVPPAGDEDYYNNLGREMDRKYPRGMYDEGEGMDGGKGNINQGPSMFITNVFLAVISVLLGAAIIGQINFNNAVTEKLSSHDAIIKLIMDGRIRDREQQR